MIACADFVKRLPAAGFGHRAQRCLSEVFWDSCILIRRADAIGLKPIKLPVAQWLVLEVSPPAENECLQDVPMACFTSGRNWTEIWLC